MTLRAIAQRNAVRKRLLLSGSSSQVARNCKTVGLRIVNVSDPKAPREVGPGYPRLGWQHLRARRPGLRGRRRFRTTYRGCVRSCGPSGGRFPGHSEASRSGFIVGDLAFVADVDSGLHIVDVSDPSGPVEVGSLDIPGFAR
jgi:hypothetical protein